MKIGIIGAGKVGVTLGKYLGEHQVTVSGYYSRTYENALVASDFTKTKAYHDIGELVALSDTLFITTPDGVIGDVWDCIKKYKLENKIICHFSGSLSSHVFSGIEEKRAAACSIHPMYAFSDRFTSYKQFHTAKLTVEGSSKALESIVPLFEKLHHTVFTVAAEDKMKYHAAAALASNYMVGLFQTSLDLLGECGFSSEKAMELLKPLVSNNVQSMVEKGPVAALTGPVERNDIETVKKHLQVLTQKETQDIYRSIGKKLVAIAEEKNPQKDYTALKTLL